MAELQPTYGNFVLRGYVKGLKRDKAYVEETSNSGFAYRRLNFSIQTSENNEVPVSLFGGKFDEVTIQPKDKEKRRDSNNRKRVPYQEDIDEKLDKDHEVFMGINIGLEKDEEGKNIRKVKFAYDAAKYIKEHLKDGDYVFINGGLRFRKYTNVEGEELTQLEYEIRSIFNSDPEKHKDSPEMSSFDQFVVINGGELNKKEKVAYISALIIADKEGTIVPYEFIVDGTKYPKLGKKLVEVPFGSLIKVEGKIHHRVIREEIEQEDDDSWGETPAGLEKREVITDVFRQLEITNALGSTYEKEKYTHEDLFPPVNKDNPFEDDSDDDANNPFNTDDDPFADNDDDLGW